MRCALMAGFLIPGLAAAQPAFAQTMAAQTATGITVRGVCSVTLAPDRARLTASVSRDAPDPARAAAEAADIARKYSAGLTAFSLPDGKITTAGITLDRITTDDSGKPIRPIFRARAAVTAETSDAPKLGQSMQMAAVDGMTDIGGLDSFLAQATRDRIVADCLPKAAADAKTRAAALLSGVGAVLGPVLRVDGYDIDGDGPTPGPRPLMRMAAASNAPPPEINLSTVTLSVSTNVTFAIGGDK